MEVMVGTVVATSIKVGASSGRSGCDHDQGERGVAIDVECRWVMQIDPWIGITNHRKKTRQEGTSSCDS